MRRVRPSVTKLEVFLAALIAAVALTGALLEKTPPEPHVCAGCSETGRARGGRGQHCGCPASEGKCALPCSTCCAPVCTGIENRTAGR